MTCCNIDTNMGGNHAYYVKGVVKIGMVTTCQGVNLCEIRGDTIYVCKEYLVNKPSKLLSKLCNSYEKDGFVEAPWMFDDNSFWDRYYKHPSEKIQM